MVSETVSGRITFVRKDCGEIVDFSDSEVVTNANTIEEDTQISQEYINQLSMVSIAVKNDNSELIVRYNFSVKLYEREDYVTIGNG